jgi:hypothetical protein
MTGGICSRGEHRPLAGSPSTYAGEG